KAGLVRKHLEKTQPGLRLVPPTAAAAAAPTANDGPIVREVQGAGKFQIRKVTKADLRKAAEALAQQETPNPFELYAGGQAPPPVRVASMLDQKRQARAPLLQAPLIDDPEFEEPLYLDDPLPSPTRPKPQIPRPAMRRPKETVRESRRAG